MLNENIDQMIEYAIECLFDNKTGDRAVVRNLVRLWPDVEILEISFALVGAADAIEGWFAIGSPSRDQSGAAYKMAALVGLDYYAMKSLDLPCGKAGDLARYWQEFDGYFLQD